MTAFAVIVGLHATWCIAEAFAARGRPAIAPPPGRLASALGLGALVVTVTSLVMSIAGAPEAAPERNLLHVGSLLVSLGIGMRLAAIRKLGNRFLDGVALLPSKHEREESGVYALMRHPAEIGYLLILLGTVLIADSRLAGVILLIWVAPLSVVRMKREDELFADSPKLDRTKGDPGTIGVS